MRLLPALLLGLIGMPAAAGPAAPGDPYLWLEEVSSPRAMAWVEAHNARATGVLEADPRYATLYAEALAIAGARDRIPLPTFTNGQIYNFWQDPQHLRGIWRRTSLASYRSAEPNWTTVLDIDALGKAEGKSWVLKDISCLEPEGRRCLVSLSDGGEDAVEVREFDTGTAAFVAGGFHLPKGKHRVAWEDADHLLVSTDWHPGELTQSGYPFIVKRLARGQAMAAAVELFRGARTDGGYGVEPRVLRDGEGRRLAVIERPLDTFRHQTYVVTPRGAERLAIPDKANVEALVAGRAIIRLNEAWAAAGAAFKAGAVAEADLAPLVAQPGRLQPRLVWTPGPQDALNGIDATGGTLLLSTLGNVNGRITDYTPKPGGGWTARPLPVGDKLAADVVAVDHGSTRAFFRTEGFLTPSSLFLADTATGEAALAKALPAKFDASQDEVEQLSATSSDGTRIPYFVVHRKGLKLDGSTPTIMTAYGGFQVSRTPNYSGITGKLWLERGGAFVLANIRGGGEFGPAWHEAGLGTRRQIVYDDFAAVAKDMFARRITSPRRLGIQGGSNGGLLMGVELIQHPDLWHAVLIQVPLLDMIRIGHIAAGASWQGEYGDVEADPKAMAFWRRLSPYQNLRADGGYPMPFIFTTTKDDRVGPQHARKFAARMEELKLPFLYYENTEGGHGSGADLRQQAHTNALFMTYMQRQLMD